LAVDFFRHDLGAAELESIAAVFKGPILTTGDTVKLFETRFAAYLDRRHALALQSCTGALHISLLACGIGPGDEVITTPMTFIATSTAILEAGARPVFVDVEPDTGNLDATKVEAAITPRTKAIMPVHLYGQCAPMDEIMTIARKHGIAVVEDAAQAIGADYNGKRAGTIGVIGCFSFFPSKNLGAFGDAGAICTDDDDFAEKCRLLRVHGSGHAYHHTMIGGML